MSYYSFLDSMQNFGKSRGIGLESTLIGTMSKLHCASESLLLGPEIILGISDPEHWMMTLYHHGS